MTIVVSAHGPTVMGAVQPINATKVGRSPEFAHRLQAWGAALCFGVFGLLTLNCASTFGGALARHIGPRLGISNRARRNLRCALPELSDDEIARVVSGMWDNLGRVVARIPASAEDRRLRTGRPR